MNEPWPGLVWEPCANPVVGCLLNDAKLTDFYNRVVPAIRAADSTTLVFFEPNVLFSEVIHTDLGNVNDPKTGVLLPRLLRDRVGVSARHHL